jgi:hypothetical protein
MKPILNDQGFLDPRSGELLDSPSDGPLADRRIEYWHLSGLHGYNFHTLRAYSFHHPDVLIEFIDITESEQRARDAHITGFPTTKVFVNGIQVGSTASVIVTKKWLDGHLNFEPSSPAP